MSERPIAPALAVIGAIVAANLDLPVADVAAAMDRMARNYQTAEALT